MRLFVAVLGLALVGGASAQSEPTGEDFCKEFSKTAGIFMKGRQAGIPIADLIERFPGKENEHYRGLIVEAYESPWYQTKRNREQAIRQFENDNYLSCYKAFHSRMNRKVPPSQ